MTLFDSPHFSEAVRSARQQATAQRYSPEVLVTFVEGERFIDEQIEAAPCDDLAAEADLSEEAEQVDQKKSKPADTALPSPSGPDRVEAEASHAESGDDRQVGPPAGTGRTSALDEAGDEDHGGDETVAPCCGGPPVDPGAPRCVSCGALRPPPSIFDATIWRMIDRNRRHVREGVPTGSTHRPGLG